MSRLVLPLFWGALFLAWIPLEVSAGDPVTLAFPINDPVLTETFVKVYKDAGLEPRVLVVPATRGNALVEQGMAVGLVMAGPMIDSSFTTRVVRIGFGGQPLAQVKIMAWVRAAEKVRRTDPRSWAELTVGWVSGTPISKSFADASGSSILVQTPTAESAGRMLAAHRLDLVFLPLGLLEGSVDTSALGLATLDAPVALVPYWHLVPAAWAGTPREAAVRAAFLKNQSLLEKVFSGFFSR